MIHNFTNRACKSRFSKPVPLLVNGVFWGAHTVREPAAHAENMQDLFTMYAKGQIKPRISASFPLEKAAEALELMQDRKVLGKVVVTVD